MRLLIVLLFFSLSLNAQPQFFAKEIKTIPPMESGYVPGLCGGEANWDCYFDAFYELWATMEGQEQVILDAKTMYQMEMYPYGIKENEFYLLDDDRTLLIKTAAVWGWQTSHRLILYDIIDKKINEAINHYYVYEFIKECKNNTFTNSKIVATKHYQELSDGGGWNGEETINLTSIDKSKYYGNSRKNFRIKKFIHIKELENIKSFIANNKCERYNKLKII